MQWLVVVVLLSCHIASIKAWYPPKPHHDDYAGVARWLVHCTDWGVMSTHSADLAGVPFRCVEEL